jgi:hypothetical protein
MTRVDCNADVVRYFDDGLKAEPAAQTARIGPLVTDIRQYFKRAYGDCAVPRDLPAPIGPGCENFGAPKPLLEFMHRDVVRGGTIRQRFDSNAGFRSTIDVGSGAWPSGDDGLRDLFVHEACHQIGGPARVCTIRGLHGLGRQQVGRVLHLRLLLELGPHRGRLPGRAPAKS